MTIEVRNVRFDLDASVPRQWHGGGAAVTTFFNNLSVVFPVGERFFIATVKAHADAVTDPTLRKHVRAFCAQEGVHGREHDRYNAWLAAHSSKTRWTTIRRCRGSTITAVCTVHTASRRTPPTCDCITERGTRRPRRRVRRLRSSALSPPDRPR